MSADPQIHVEPDESTWREIDQWVERLASLADSAPAPDAFYRELLDGTVRTLAAVGGAVWLSERPGCLDLRYQIALERLELNSPEDQARHHGLVAMAVASGATQVFPARCGAPSHSGIAGPAGNPTDYPLLVCPLMVDGQPLGALEIVQRPQTDPAAFRGHQRVVAMVGELALEYERDRQLERYRHRLEQAEQCDQFARRVHAPLEPEAVAYEIANEGRRFIGCDRLSVAVVHRRNLQLAAISGVDTFDRRANAVRRLEALARRVAASGESFWYDGQWDAVPPPLESDLRAYVDESHVRSLGILPLYSRGEPGDGEFERDASQAPAPSENSRAVGVLVVERYEAGWDAAMADRVTTVARHSRVALANAHEYRSLPLLPVSRAIRGVLRQFHADRLPRSLAVVIALAAVVLLLLLLPAPFRVSAAGQLEPVQSRNVYAPEDGDVRRLLVEHNEPVDAGTPLLELANPELELERQRIETERLTTQRQLESIGILRVTEDGQGEVEQPAVRRDQLSARELEMTQLLESQQRQIDIIQRQLQALTVRSPLAGRVLTWDLERLLEDRPVKRGQLLMRVADVDGPWLAELDVPDRRIGHVLRAARQRQGDLSVSFLLGTDPSRSYQARILEIARTAVPDEDGRPVVRVKVRVDETLSERHPGATVRARIDCGYRPLGYVWLHDLIDTVRSRILF